MCYSWRGSHGVPPTTGSTTEGITLVASLTGFPCCSLVMCTLLQSTFVVTLWKFKGSTTTAELPCGYTWWYYITLLRSYSAGGTFKIVIWLCSWLLIYVCIFILWFYFVFRGAIRLIWPYCVDLFCYLETTWQYLMHSWCVVMEPGVSLG